MTERVCAHLTPLILGQRAWRLPNDSRPDDTIVKRNDVLQRNPKRPFDHLARCFSKIRLSGVTPNDLIGAKSRFEFRIRRHNQGFVTITRQFGLYSAVEKGKAWRMKRPERDVLSDLHQFFIVAFVNDLHDCKAETRQLLGKLIEIGRSRRREQSHARIDGKHSHVGHAVNQSAQWADFGRARNDRQG